MLLPGAIGAANNVGAVAGPALGGLLAVFSLLIFLDMIGLLDSLYQLLCVWLQAAPVDAGNVTFSGGVKLSRSTVNV